MHQITPQPQQILILHKEKITGEKETYIYILQKKKRKPDANRELELVNWSCSHRVISQKTVKKLPLLILVFVLLLKSNSEWSKNNQKKFEKKVWNF